MGPNENIRYLETRQILDVFEHKGKPIAHNLSHISSLTGPPQYFPIILDYLRGFPLDLPTSDKELRKVWYEADFYRLEGLKKMLPSYGLLLHPAFDLDCDGAGTLEGQGAGAARLVEALDHLFAMLPDIPSWSFFLGLPRRVCLRPVSGAAIVSFKLLGHGSFVGGNFQPPWSSIKVRRELLAPDGRGKVELIALREEQKILTEIEVRSYWSRTDWKALHALAIHNERYGIQRCPPGDCGSAARSDSDPLKTEHSILLISRFPELTSHAARRIYNLPLTVTANNETPVAVMPDHKFMQMRPHYVVEGPFVQIRVEA
eukprot:jgi/Botrbrau1/20599/Bobra.113_1s0025.1